MHGPSRRRLAAAAASATLGLALTSAAAPAGAAPPCSGTVVLGVCVPVPIPTVVPGGSPTVVPGGTGMPAVPTQAQLLMMITALTPAQVQQAVPQQVADAIGKGTGADLATLLARVTAALMSSDPQGELTKIVMDPTGTGAGTGTGTGTGAGTGAGAGTGTGTGSNPGTGTGSGTGSGSGTTPGSTKPLAFRARVKSVKIAKNRRSARIVVACPSDPGCFVALSGKVGSRKAFKTQALPVKPGATATRRVKLSSSVAKRLRKRGGRLKVTATTAFSSLPPSSKNSAKAKKSRRKKH
ncbi:MAG: hypothetical protein ACR2NB_09755 [Solirubrobacteraceae bacterium]